MSHSIIRGLKHGIKRGVKHGAASLYGGTWSVDAASLKGVPATAGEWTAAGIATPSLLWLLQEASGSVADSIGTFTGTATGTLTYQSAVAGWTRVGIKTTAGVAGDIRNTAAGLPDISTTSAMLMVYALMPAAAGTTRTLTQLGTTWAADATLQTAAAGKLIVFAGSTTTGTAALLDSAVHPLILKVDRTGAVVKAYSDQEALSATVGGSGKSVLLGGDNVMTWLPDNVTYLYATLWSGASAEMSDSQVRTMLQTLGWTVAW